MAKMRKMFAMKKQAQERIKRICPGINTSSGIYVFYRLSEERIKYAYVGQSKNLLDRCANHLVGYQAIDLSIKKHGLYDEKKRPYGYRLFINMCPVDWLDKYEQETILQMSRKGYQLKNKTSGGQGVGKVGMENGKAPKGYRDGLERGYKNCQKEIAVFFEKYLDVSIKGEPNKIKERKLQDFLVFLGSKNQAN